MKKQTPQDGRKTVYVAIADNVYYTGSSYRVRVRHNNNLVSKNFKQKSTALKFSKSLKTVYDLMD